MAPGMLLVALNVASLLVLQGRGCWNAEGYNTRRFLCPTRTHGVPEEDLSFTKYDIVLDCSPVAALNDNISDNCKASGGAASSAE